MTPTPPPSLSGEAAPLAAVHRPAPSRELYDGGNDLPCVALFDASEHGKILVEGAEAVRVLNQIWPAPDQQLLSLEVGSGIEVGLGAVKSTVVYRLRSDQFLVHTPPAYESEVVQRLTRHTEPGAGLITVTPVTHGRAELRLVATAESDRQCDHRCRVLLSRVCGLDFSPAAFPNLTARTTSLAKTRQLVIRKDQDGMLTFAIIGPRSLGAYVLATLAEAGHDLGLVVGGAAVEQ